jgi:5-methyltetrahydropteroyltriglutamate--homocysteine methyltransferase
MITAHADHVGSLLRPAELLAARDELASGRLEPADFKRIEDRGVRHVVELQEAAGMPVVTDGELRRESFQSELTASCSGFSGVSIDAWLWGDWHSEAQGDLSIDRPPELAVTAPLRKLRSLAAEEFTYLRSVTGAQAKVTIPSPSLFANLWSPDRSREAYPAVDDFLEEVAEILADEVRELARLGCTYVQLDAPHYPLLIEERWREFYEARGWSTQAWLSRGIELDNAVIDAAPSVTFGFHLCRGNQGSRWLVSGDYEPIAAQVLGGIRADRLLLEYDDERSGGFEPLSHVRDDAMVLLGLVTTKSGRVETTDDLRGRVTAASTFVPLDRLGVSTQCGFSTSIVGNAVTEEDERRKLGVLAATAEQLWG